MDWWWIVCWRLADAYVMCGAITVYEVEVTYIVFTGPVVMVMLFGEHSKSRLMELMCSMLTSEPKEQSRVLVMEWTAYRVHLR